jgi:hypothetical protein
MASATTTATATATAETSKEDSKVYSRAYQLEMLEESLKRNVIVAVCSTLWSFAITLIDDTLLSRWTLGAAKHMCMPEDFL